MHLTYRISVFFLVTALANVAGQSALELNSVWFTRKADAVKESGTVISKNNYSLKNWMSATVPGTVLTTLLNNKLIPDPFYGMNNKKIPDIFMTGKNYYTYWFVKDFIQKTEIPGEQTWLDFRGINYGCDVYLNGKKLNETTLYGMFLRHQFNITEYLSKDGNNRLAVLVLPPEQVGNPNGGQGGDGEIARSVTNQFVAGWDWIQPVADRNTGIWDKVILRKTQFIRLKNVHAVTRVPGIRYPDQPQSPVQISASAEIENPGKTNLKATLRYVLGDDTIRRKVVLKPMTTMEVRLPDYLLKNPKLWWPNGYGSQDLYDLYFQVTDESGKILDSENVRTGIREIQTQWNDRTQSIQIRVNGQKIFIKGGNWILSDALLRFSKERYDAEVRFHRDMNLNLIRVWGGAITERPEFFEACDKYGLLVFHDFWMSGDCNGKWMDPLKKEDQWTRRRYPDDHSLFLNSVIDQVKMIRNHPSLAFWCGGNEISPPEDILIAMKDSILPKLDSTRFFFTYSNSNLMSFNSLGGNGDGPYTIQPVGSFWEKHTYPFNSEVGSVGLGDYESLERFIPRQNMTSPSYPEQNIDSVWQFHKYLGYDQYIDVYGKPTDIQDFCSKAQLVNFDQYRALMEGFCSHMWEWYTGTIIWKTQNPWTAMRGQMYDYYLDPNACLYGLRSGSEPLHVMMNPVDGMLMTVNHTFQTFHDLMMEVKVFDMKGQQSLISRLLIEVNPSSAQRFFSIKEVIDKMRKQQGLFLSLRLINSSRQTLSDNFYWLADSSGIYSGLQNIPRSTVKITSVKESEGTLKITVTNHQDGPVSFFNRVSLIDKKTEKRILPVFYSDNYFSVLPGEKKDIRLNYPEIIKLNDLEVSLSGWNTPLQQTEIK